MINYLLLTDRAKEAHEYFLKSHVLDLSNPSHQSILKQIEFIIKCAAKGKNPTEELPAGQTFTYSVIASREFSSPDELAIKKRLDEMSQALYYQDYQKL